MLLLLAMSIIFLFLSLMWLDKYPLVWADEISYSQPAWTFIEEGHFGYFIPMYELDKTNVVFGRIYLLLAALAFLISGKPNIYAVRFVSYLAGVFCVLLVYLISCRLYEKRTAVLSTILLALSPNFFWTFRNGRPELLFTMFLLLSILLIIIAKQRNSLLMYLTSGIMASLCIDVHINGIVVPIIILAVYASYVKKSNTTAKFFTKPFFAIIAGIFLGLFYWIIVHILIPSQKLFFYQWKGFFQGLQGRINPNPLQMLISEFKRYYEFFWLYKYHRNLPFLIISLGGIVFAIKKRSSGDKIILGTIAISCLFMALFVTNKTSHYFTWIIPLLSILVANWVLAQKKTIHIYLLLFSIIGYYLLQNGAYMYFFPTEEYTKYISAIKGYIPEKSTVLGQPVHWPAFYKQKFYANDGAYYSLKTFPEIIKQYNIEYIIVNDVFNYWLQHNLVLKQQVELFLSNNCQLVGSVENRFYEKQAGYERENRTCLTEIYKVKVTS